MNKLQLAITGLSVFFLTIACDVSSEQEQNSESTNIEVIESKDITASEFKSLISDKTIVLDVRTKNEFDAGHIENAVNIDFFSDNFVDEVMKLDHEKSLLIHCASGGRSAKAMNSLEGKGFKSLYNMLGGFGTWKSNGFPVIK